MKVKAFRGAVAGLLLFFFHSSLATETKPLSSPPASLETPKSVKKNVKKPSRRARAKKPPEDFWTRCQGFKKSMDKADLDDSVYPKAPLVQDMPSVKPTSIPCKFQPDTKSTAGARAKCAF